MKIKAIALDLDGTLLTSEKKISDINKTVLKYLENKGVKTIYSYRKNICISKAFCNGVRNR